MLSTKGRAVLLSVALALASCSSNQSTGEDNNPIPGISPYQREILADGVTQAEVERAVLDTVSCIRSHGYDALADFGTELGHLTFSISYATPDDSADADGAYTECVEQYLEHVDRAWTAEVFDSDLEERFEAALLACLESEGFDIDLSRIQESRDRAYNSNPEAFDACFDEAVTVYDP